MPGSEVAQCLQSPVNRAPSQSRAFELQADFFYHTDQQTVPHTETLNQRLILKPDTSLRPSRYTTHCVLHSPSIAAGRTPRHVLAPHPASPTRLQQLSAAAVHRLGSAWPPHFQLLKLQPRVRQQRALHATSFPRGTQDASASGPSRVRWIMQRCPHPQERARMTTRPPQLHARVPAAPVLPSHAAAAAPSPRSSTPRSTQHGIQCRHRPAELPERDGRARGVYAPP